MGEQMAYERHLDEYIHLLALGPASTQTAAAVIARLHNGLYAGVARALGNAAASNAQQSAATAPSKNICRNV